MRLMLFLFGCQESVHVPADVAYAAGCETGTRCGAEVGEADGRGCLEYNAVLGAHVCMDSGESVCAGDEGDACPGFEYNGYNECFRSAYETAYETAREEAGCDDSGGDSG